MEFRFTTDDLASSSTDRKILAFLVATFLEASDVEITTDGSPASLTVYHKPSVQEEPQKEPQEETRQEEVQEEKPKRGRKPKPPQQMTAAELHQALKAEETPVQESVPEAPATPTDDGADHDDLVNKVREQMFARGHVWMRNVLEAHKKVAKTMAEFPVSVLKEILANPERYDD